MRPSGRAGVATASYTPQRKIFFPALSTVPRQLCPATTPPDHCGSETRACPGGPYILLFRINFGAPTTKRARLEHKHARLYTFAPLQSKALKKMFQNIFFGGNPSGFCWCPGEKELKHETVPRQRHGFTWPMLKKRRKFADFATKMVKTDSWANREGHRKQDNNNIFLCG